MPNEDGLGMYAELSVAQVRSMTDLLHYGQVYFVDLSLVTEVLLQE